MSTHTPIPEKCLHAIQQLHQREPEIWNANSENALIHCLAVSGLFDATWYLKEYPDVAASDIDPLLHYVRYGEKEGRKASPVLDAETYHRLFFRSAIIYSYCLSSGGLERVACDLSFALKKLGFDVYFVLDRTDNISYAYHGKIYKMVLNEELKDVIKSALFVFDFKYKDPSSEHPFVKYCTEKYPEKYIATIHNTKTCFAYYEVIKKYLNEMSGALLHSILCVSFQVKNEFILRYGESKNIRVLHNSIDINSIQTQAIKKNIFDFDYILFLGRLSAHEHKGIDFLLDAFERIDRKSLHLVLAGDGELDAKLKNILQNSRYKDYIHLVGFRTDVYSLMHHAKFLVSPSRWEGFGMVRIECLAAGTPVLSSKTGVADEVIIHKHNGYLIPPEDTFALQSGMEYMIEYADSMRSCYTQSVQNFSREIYTQKLKEILFR